MTCKVSATSCACFVGVVATLGALSFSAMSARAQAVDPTNPCDQLDPNECIFPWRWASCPGSVCPTSPRLVPKRSIDVCCLDPLGSYYCTYSRTGDPTPPGCVSP